MHGKNICGLLMAALLWAGLTASPLAAQNEGQQSLVPVPEAASPGFLRVDPANEDADGNRTPSDWAGLSVKKLERRVTGRSCPKNFQDFIYCYPQGLDNVVLDGEIERMITERFNKEVGAAEQGGLCDKEFCDGASCGEWFSNWTFEVHRPSAGYASILFSEYTYTGGAHANTNYLGLNYNLRTGQPMTLMELFPQPQVSVPKYWAMVYKQWCDNADYKFPLHYQKHEPCGQPDTAANPNTYAWASGLEDLGRLVFTPHGASLVLGPYESGSFASGTVMLDFTKEEMIAIGASPSVWAQ